MLQFREDSYLVLNFEYGYYKILMVTVVVLLFSHWFDLYDPSNFNAKWEQVFRLLLVLGLVALALAGVGFVFPHSLPGHGSSLIGLIILTFALFVWRGMYAWLAQRPYLRERVYVLGTGERAQRLVNGLRTRSELGVEVAGWSGNLGGAVTRESIASLLMELAGPGEIHRAIVAMPDRRGTFPVNELLKLPLEGVKIEEATSWLEKISGRIEVEQLNPSWLLFAEGFRVSAGFSLLRRLASFFASALLLVIVLPVIPFVILCIKPGSTGPPVYPL